MCDARTGIVAKNFFFSARAALPSRSRLAIAADAACSASCASTSAFCAFERRRLRAGGIRARRFQRALCNIGRGFSLRPVLPAPPRPPSSSRAGQTIGEDKRALGRGDLRVGQRRRFLGRSHGLLRLERVRLCRHERRARGRHGRLRVARRGPAPRSARSTKPTRSNRSRPASQRSSQCTSAAMASSAGNSPLTTSPCAASESRSAWR